MEAVKERIIGAVTLMPAEEATALWGIIQQRYVITPRTWEDIEEEEPDDIDLAMMAEIENDPECREFVPEEEAMKILGME